MSLNQTFTSTFLRDALGDTTYPDAALFLSLDRGAIVLNAAFVT